MSYIKATFKIDPILPAREILIAELGELNFESFVETEHGLEAYIRRSHFTESELEELSLLKNPEFSISYNWEEVKDENWNAAWEENFTPINVDHKCLIRAPFHPADPEIQLEVLIQPQMSFGTGHHETTFLMVQKLLELDLQGKVVLDMGCGTGVLAILAEKLGAAKINAIDIDNWAYQNTLENVSLNNCSKIITEEGGAELLEGKEFDLVIANINRNILIGDMEKYRQVLKEKGTLLLSGFFTVDNPILEEKAAELGMRKVAGSEKNTWSLLHLEVN